MSDQRSGNADQRSAPLNGAQAERLRLSVVIPTFNRLARLRQVVAALEAQTTPLDQFEVVVISDGSTDGTHTFLENLETPLSLQVLEQANQGVAVARNTGIQHASGELVLFIDDDVVPAPTLIEEHLAGHVESGLVVLGPMLSPPGFEMSRWVRWEQAMLMKQYDDIANGRWQPTARQFYTGNTSLERSHLLAAGGFDPRFRRAEDVELAYRLDRRGLRFVFRATAIGWHYAERSFASWLKIPYAYGRNDVIFTRDLGQTWLLPTIGREFHGRHVLTRSLARLCLDRSQLSAVAIATLAWAARMDAFAPRAYSGIFNLLHYQGIADELGGRTQFFNAVRSAQHAAPPPGPAGVSGPP